VAVVALVRNRKSGFNKYWIIKEGGNREKILCVHMLKVDSMLKKRRRSEKACVTLGSNIHQALIKGGHGFYFNVSYIKRHTTTEQVPGYRL
jgi:hypothetical protein